MNLIICLDERNGYSLFNKRQSSDVEVLKKIIDYTKNQKLYITEYTAKVFNQNELKPSFVTITKDPQSVAQKGEFVFVETGEIKCIPEKIIAFYWNRHYQSDLKYEIDEKKYRIVKEEKLIGKSHPEITVKHLKKRLLKIF